VDVQSSSVQRERGSQARAVDTVRSIPLKSIVTPRNRIRRVLGDIASLADSIQEYGLLHPISVRKQGREYVLTIGERRLEAVKLLQWTAIPAFVRDMDADRAYVVDLVENLQRQDLTLEEEADGLIELVRTRGWTLEQVAAAIKRSVGYVSKRVRVFEDPALRAAITREGLPVSTAEELLAVDPDRRADLVRRAVAEHWDQPMARLAVQQATEPPTANDELSESTAAAVNGRAIESRPLPVSTGRPAGFTEKIREFHRLIVDVRPEELTQPDRSALRSLFKDLVLLARAPAARTVTVFPPLPTTGGNGSKRGRTDSRR